VCVGSHSGWRAHREAQADAIGARAAVGRDGVVRQREAAAAARLGRFRPPSSPKVEASRAQTGSTLAGAPWPLGSPSGGSGLELPARGYSAPVLLPFRSINFVCASNFCKFSPPNELERRAGELARARPQTGPSGGFEGVERPPRRPLHKQWAPPIIISANHVSRAPILPGRPPDGRLLLFLGRNPIGRSSEHFNISPD